MGDVDESPVDAGRLRVFQAQPSIYSNCRLATPKLRLEAGGAQQRLAWPEVVYALNDKERQLYIPDFMSTLMGSPASTLCKVH